MNDARRKKLSRLYDKLEGCRDELEQIRDQEQQAYDNMPVSVQDTDRGIGIYEALDNLENAHGLLEEVLEGIDNAKGET